MQIIYKKLDELKEYDNNPRNNSEAVNVVAQSISDFGFKVPIVITSDNVIIAGHTRLKAALKLGLEEVPCIIADDLTDEQIKAFRLVDNKTSEFATWDIAKLEQELKDINLDLSTFGFDYPTVETSEEKTHEDNFDIDEELPTIPYSKLGDIYLLGRHKLICADSTIKETFDKLLDTTAIDLIVTDPPYNVNVGSKGETNSAFDNRKIKNDNLDRDEFIEFLSSAFTNMERVLKKGGAFYVFHASSSITEFDIALRKVELKPRQQLIWKKNTFVLGRQDYQWIHENLYYGFKEGEAHYFINDRTQSTVIDSPYLDFNELSKKELVKLLEDIYLKVYYTVLDEKKPAKCDLHPTMKPINLIGTLIKNSSHVGDNVLDPFGGSGSTLIASNQLGRNCYLIELDEKYVDVIVKRYIKEFGSDNCYLVRDGVKININEIKELEVNEKDN